MTESTESAGTPLVSDDPSIIPQQPGQGCPPPLTWHEVLRQFRDASEPFAIPQDGISVTGLAIGSGSPLYFLNGLSATSDAFCLLAWLLRDEFRCVLLDFPPARTFEELAHAPLTVADALGHDTFNLFATSYGTLPALELLQTDAGRRVNRAVLQGPLVALRLSWAERLLSLLAGWSPGSMDRVPFRRRILEASHRRWFPPIDATRWDFFAQLTGQPSIARVARLGRLANGRDYSHCLAKITTPVLAISSEGDAHRHRTAAEVLAHGLPDCRLEVLPNTGHIACLTHPHRIANLLRPFLTPTNP